MSASNPAPRPDARLLLLTVLFAACRTDATLEPDVPGATADLGAGPAATGHIAFVTDRDGNFEIYSMNPDGSGQTNLTNDPRADFQPAWSPDGSRIAFSRVEFDGSQHLWLMNADGTAQQQVNNNDGGDPSWSPDGTRLVYNAFSPTFTDFDIRVTNVDGTGDVAITTGPDSDFIPSWSPDGALISFSSNREKVVGNYNHTSVYLMRPDGSDITRLTTMSGAEFIARWAPDGTRLVLAHQAQEIWVINRDGTGLHRIDHAQSYESLGGYSPDGQYIVFDAGKRSFKGAANVYVMDAEGGNVVQLTTGSGYSANSAWGR